MTQDEVEEWARRLKAMSDQMLAKRIGSTYRTCRTCYWWDDKQMVSRDDCDMCPCQQRHVARLFGESPLTSYNFGCIHHSAVPPEVVR